ncbi:MAG: GNAT family N-acetyltransferase [Tagaea sp.]
MTASGSALLPDPWLSAGLGRPAYRFPAGAGGVSADIGTWAQRPVFVTAKLPAMAVAETIAFQDAGFRVVDTALVFAGALAAAQPSGVRKSVAGDRAGVEALARVAFTTSRFHLDPAFPKPLAGAIKAAWAANFFAGKRGDLMLVAERDGTVEGFLLALRGPGAWAVDLIATDPAARGRGIGRRLMARLAAEPVDGAPPSRIRAGTQAANAAALGFYARLGFAIERAEFVLHHHGAGGPYPEEFQA